MRGLATAELLAIWERGIAQPASERALMLLAAACSAPAEELAQLTLGQRDEHLLSLRELVFGPRLKAIADCPACGEKLDVALNVADLRQRAAPEKEELSVAAMGYEVRFRLPTSADLACLRPAEYISTNRLRILERCVLSVRGNGSEPVVAGLPEEVVSLIANRMAEADPQADIRLVLNCPACAHQWSALFDIVSFFWTEINAWAVRLLREVHVLASAYGWRENDILSLTPARRQAYLEMVGA